MFALQQLGRVQAVSAMVGGAAWADGARILRTLDPEQLEVGLHLDFTECPLLEQSRKPHRQLLLQAFTRRLDGKALQQEIHAQLDAFEHAMGRAPAYVDGHQHVHQLPGICEQLLQAIAQRYPTRRPWLRSTRSPASAAHADWRTQAKSRVIEWLGNRGLQAGAQRLGLLQNGHLLGVYDFHGDARHYQARLAQWLRAARDGDVLMCHPGLESMAEDAIAAARLVEFAVLSGPGFAALLAASQVRLLPLHRILQTSPG